MRDGLDFTEDYVDAGVSDVIEMLFGAGKDDVAAYAEARPLAHEPGTRFNYSSGTSNIVAAIAGRCAGSGAAFVDLLRRRVFEPVGMASADPRLDDAGTFIGSSYVYATARDFTRFGLLYLRDGMWNGQRILPEGWVDHARRLRSVDEEGNGYGAHWWVVDDDQGSFRASGYEGQAILICPGLDVVAVRLGRFHCRAVSGAERVARRGRRLGKMIRWPCRRASTRRPVSARSTDCRSSDRSTRRSTTSTGTAATSSRTHRSSCSPRSDADGRVDVSPKGGPAGFVAVLDDHRLAIPDMSGNNRLDSMRNIVSGGAVALLFMVPGTDETMRVNGRATITRRSRGARPRVPSTACRPTWRSWSRSKPRSSTAPRRCVGAASGNLIAGPTRPTWRRQRAC